MSLLWALLTYLVLFALILRIPRTRRRSRAWIIYAVSLFAAPPLFGWGESSILSFLLFWTAIFCRGKPWILHPDPDPVRT